MKRNMQTIFGVFDYFGKPKPSIFIGFTPTRPMLSSIILDEYNCARLLKFTKDIIIGINKKDEYWTNGYTAQVVEKDGKKILKIFFRLTDEYAPDYISIEEFNDILELFIKEKKEFDYDPESYKIKLAKKGAEILNMQDYENNEKGYMKVAEEAEKGVVFVKTLKEKLELEKAAAIKIRKPWQFWKK